MAEKKPKKLSGIERSAVLLLTIGEEDAGEIMRHMSPKEVQAVGEAMATIGGVSKEQVAEILENFAESIEEQTSLGVGSEDYLRKVLTNALGEEKAGALIDRILMGRNSKGLDALKWMEPRAVADIIRLEHPQIIAIVLSYLEPDRAADVLSALPENMRVDVVMRIASLDGIQPSAINELDDMLEQQFSGNSENIKTSSVGGLKTAANIMNYLEPGTESEIMEYVKESDIEMAEGIQDLMFVFDNLIDIDDRGIQVLLRETSSDILITALKGADEDVKEKVFKNMSKRAGEMLRDDLESKGPVKISDVENAQKEVLSIARRLADSGEINLKSSDEYI
ncbi:MAG: flagellar motor switch protein FliG [Gammaproteobacteria bacterium]|nr:flagellar motor switch protein FliG [Gammaproteobacteria bacterium]MDH5652942.1 flagellar motor switch protein FliG [Gammaproteobacteria bacterium]